MANTSIMKTAENYVLLEALPKLFSGHLFQEASPALIWGGRFDFDAVSQDGTIVGLISTSTLKTSGGNYGSGKVNKILKDCLYLLYVEGARKRFLAFTETCMKHEFETMKEKGRFPPEIQLIHTPLPSDLNKKVKAVRQKASDEVSPR